jgi:hypothetical protein
MDLKRYLPLLSFYCALVASVPCLAGGAGGAASSPENSGVEQLQQQMLSDPEIMSRILELESDPQMQGLLTDPKVMDAVAAGDLKFLLGDPRFRKLLGSRQVKDIGKKLERQNGEAAH